MPVAVGVDDAAAESERLLRVVVDVAVVAAVVAVEVGAVVLKLRSVLRRRLGDCGGTLRRSELAKCCWGRGPEFEWEAEDGDEVAVLGSSSLFVRAAVGGKDVDKDRDEVESFLCAMIIPGFMSKQPKR